MDVTHEFLAVMIAFGRSGVTDALHVLEGKRLIYAKRSLVTVRDRAALEEFAGPAYGPAERGLVPRKASLRAQVRNQVRVFTQC
ncbi:hypothetical protein [Rhizobium leguminosarum]|uniref:hypothetical protein n=1 Tax=Rhizobium leguminosarum TaxID=384 RepID=UPI00391F3416